MHDTVDLEDRGLPSVFVATVEFVSGADAQAKALGFLNRVTEPDRLAEEVDELAARLSAQPSYSLELTKRHVNEVAEESGSTANSIEDARALIGALEDPESLARMGSYLAGRGSHMAGLAATALAHSAQA